MNKNVYIFLVLIIMLLVVELFKKYLNMDVNCI